MTPYSTGHRNPYPNPSANPSGNPHPNPSSNPLARRARGTYNPNHNRTYNLTSLSSDRCVVAMAEIGLFGNHRNARATQRPRITT